MVREEELNCIRKKSLMNHSAAKSLNDNMKLDKK